MQYIGNETRWGCTRLEFMFGGFAFDKEPICMEEKLIWVLGSLVPYVDWWNVGAGVWYDIIFICCV